MASEGRRQKGRQEVVCRPPHGRVGVFRVWRGSGSGSELRVGVVRVARGIRVQQGRGAVNSVRGPLTCTIGANNSDALPGHKLIPEFSNDFPLSRFAGRILNHQHLLTLEQRHKLETLLAGSGMVRMACSVILNAHGETW